MKKLAIVTSHPIQYNAPLFRLLTERGKIAVRVFYTWGQTESGLVYDPDFKKEFKWDIPLLDGYEKEFVENISKEPGAGHFKGIQNKNLIERIDGYNPDALLVFGWSFHSHLQVLRHYKGRKKILFRGDSTLLDEPKGISLKKILRRMFLTWVYHHIDVGLYTGVANKAYYRKHGVRDKQLVYAPHAVAVERFIDEDGAYAKKAKELRRELGIGEDAVVFLFAGKIESKKDPLLLIDAFKSVPGDTIHLVMTGNGVLEREAKDSAAGDRRIVFLGFQNQQQMPVIYQLCDVFVLPSQGPGETWGLSVNEAMAGGRAVLVSDRCGCAADLVSENGLVFRAGDRESLRNALLFFAENKFEISKMGTKGFSFIQSFTLDAVAAAIEASV